VCVSDIFLHSVFFSNPLNNRDHSSKSFACPTNDRVPSFLLLLSLKTNAKVGVCTNGLRHFLLFRIDSFSSLAMRLYWTRIVDFIRTYVAAHRESNYDSSRPLALAPLLARKMGVRVRARTNTRALPLKMTKVHPKRIFFIFFFAASLYYFHHERTEFD
jgi:hypothetical protein